VLFSAKCTQGNHAGNSIGSFLLIPVALLMLGLAWKAPRHDKAKLEIR
jgi:hypothetical protein